METNNCPLVSVRVITYNSSKTVLETLESIKAQTYQNIELIISDDCSTDDTVNICKKWVSENRDRFVRTVVLEFPVNTGISANCNRAEASCQGTWIKPIAGDDLLLPECIESLIEYVSNTPDAYMVFGRFIAFGGNEELRSCTQSLYDKNNDILNGLSIEEQKEYVIKGIVPHAPVSFYCRRKFIECGIVYDERIRNVEDYPRWVNVLSKGIKFHFLDKYIVKYRVGTGVSFGSREQSVEMYKCRRQVYFYYIFPQEYLKEPEATIAALIDDECALYGKYLKHDKFVNKVKRNKFYKVTSLFYRLLHSINK